MVLLSLIFALLALQLSSSEECPALFQRYARSHSFCKDPNLSCKIQTSGVEKKSSEIILNEHNIYRSNIAIGKVPELPTGANMMQMVWDDELADVAQHHANQCKFEHDCANCRRVQNFGVGQNIAMQMISNKAPVPSPDWPTAIKYWYDEIKYINKAVLDPFVMDSRYGHFSQLLWADTWRIGCGYTCFNEEGQFKQLYVCNYGPAGNILKQSLYKKGEPCSLCPVNSCCGQTCRNALYPGLCRLNGNGVPPLPKLDSKKFFYCDFQDQADCDYCVTGKEWKIYNTLSGNYVGVLLNGGEESSITFKKLIKPTSETFCFAIKYRKGANVDGEESNNKAVETFTIKSQNYQVNQELQTFSEDFKHQFSQFSMSLSWNMETEFKLTFSVPPGKPAQFLEVQSLSGTEGACS